MLDEAMGRCADYIEENLQTDVNAEELAALSGFSVYHFYRLFQQSFGMPVMRYILRRRLSHAIYEMKMGGPGIDAALRYGFDTYAGFYRAFQREFGCTPSQYLKEGRARMPVRPDPGKETPMCLNRKKRMEILKNWGLEDRDTAQFYHANGQLAENVFAVGEDMILKCTADRGRAARNMALSRLLVREGLLAAVPVPALDGRDSVEAAGLTCTVARRLPGQPLAAAAFYADPALAPRLGEAIGRMHRALKAAQAAVDDADMLEAVKSWALEGTKKALGPDGALCEKYLPAFAALYPTLPRQIIHRDANPGIVIAGEDGWGFVDFDLSERNARIFDPCYAATAILSESFEEGNAEKLDRWIGIFRGILAGYDGVVHLTENERRAAPLMILANQMICVAWFREQGRYPEILDTNIAMTRWIMANMEKISLA